MKFTRSLKFISRNVYIDLFRLHYLSVLNTYKSEEDVGFVQHNILLRVKIFVW